MGYLERFILLRVGFLFAMFLYLLSVISNWGGNWDTTARVLFVMFSFVPFVVGNTILGYVLFSKRSEKK